MSVHHGGRGPGHTSRKTLLGAFDPGSTPTPDTTPNAFSFTDVTDATLSTLYESDEITVAGLGAGESSAISITGGEYLINGGSPTSAPGTVVNGDTVAIQVTSSASNSTAVDAVLTIGGVSDTYTVTTVAIDAPTAPVLTKTSDAGVNPMSWSGLYTDLTLDDVIRLSWTKNGGAATTETHTVTSDDLIAASEGSFGFDWTGFVTASAGFVDGDVIAVQERIERDGVNSDYSNTLTDTVVVAVTVNEGVVVQEGDSIVAWGNGFADMFADDYPGYTVNNLATGGHGLSNLETDEATARAYDAEVVSVLIGANDLEGYTGGAAAYYADLVAYAAGFRSDGAKVVLCTVLPQSGATTFNSRRATLNGLLRDGVGTDFDHLCDWDNSPMGDDADASDVAKYSDGVHPTEPAGHLLLYANYRGAMLEAFGVAREVAQFTFTDETSAPASTVTASDAIVVQGLAYLETKAVSVTGGEYRKNGGAWTGTAGTVTNGDTVEVRGTSSATESGVVDVVLTIGSVSDTFRITTEAAASNTMVMSASDKAASLTVSGDGLTISQATDPQVSRLVRSTIPFTGKRYAEMTVNTRQGVFTPQFGVCNSTASLTAMPGDGNANGGGLDEGGNIEPSQTYFPGTLANGDVVMLAVDEPNKLLWIGKNGSWSATTNPATGTNGESFGALANCYLFVGLARIDNVTVNTGGSPFAYTPPSGFTAMP